MPARKPQVKKAEPKAPVVRRPRKQAVGKIPDRMSEALIVAIDDLEKIEKRKDMRIEMSGWVSAMPKDAGGGPYCGVCLAASSMIETMGLTIEETIERALHEVDRIDDTTKYRLFAIDQLRRGFFPKYWFSAFRNKDADIERFISKEVDKYGFIEMVVKYHVDPKKFKKQIRSIARLLKEYDL